MIRSHFTAAVPGLIVSHVNFEVSCSVHNHRFCFQQVWCPPDFASLGHSVLLKFGLQYNLSYKVIKKKVQHCSHISCDELYLCQSRMGTGKMKVTVIFPHQVRIPS